MTLVHTVNDAMTAILGALLPTLQVRFDAGPTTLALMVAVFWIASSVTQPVFGALGEDVGLRLIGCIGVLMASTFLSLIGAASEVWLVFVLLVTGGLGSAALHPIGTTIAGSQAKNPGLGIGRHDYSPDAAIIGWTLSAFAFAGGLGSILGGFLAPRLGAILTIVGAFLLTLCPLLTVIATEPGTAAYFTAIVLAGILIFVPVPALVIIAQEFIPGAPATAAPMVLGLGSALAGIGYIVLGRVQETIGLTHGILIGFSMVVPAALITLVVLLRGASARVQDSAAC